jgi:hypothetical protein
MKLADLKRLPIGTELRLVKCLMGDVAEGYQGRRLARVQSNALAFAVEQRGYEGELSWLTFPRAKDFRETEDGFEVLEDGEVAARYVWVRKGD